MMLTPEEVKQRAQQAEDLFRQGYNCAQSVYLAYADLFGLDPQLAARIAAPMGAGMGRLREVCGACSAMALVAGLAIPCDNPSDMNAKRDCYALVQKAANRFKEENGSIICRELLGLSNKPEGPTPSPRTETYYKKRPCAELVRMAASIIGEEMLSIS